MTKNNFISYLKENEPKNEVILDVQNIALLKSKIVYARSCKSAKVLGFQAVKDIERRHL